jgi:hypothetical protein
MKKVVLLSDKLYLNTNNSQFVKTAAGQRLAHQVRRLGVDVFTLCNFTTFDIYEFNKFLESISENNKHELIVVINTSFLPPMFNKKLLVEDQPKGEAVWGIVLDKIKLFASLAKRKYGATILLSGSYIEESNYFNFAFFQKYIDRFVIGDGYDVIPAFIKGDMVSSFTAHDLKFIRGGNITDFAEQSSAPILQDCIQQNEFLYSDTAAGCMFACSFCNYPLIGKKKEEYMENPERKIAESTS